jgi:hypothetical protein
MDKGQISRALAEGGRNGLHRPDAGGEKGLGLKEKDLD